MKKSALRVGLVTLGCDKNTVDMEYTAGLLAQGGCVPMPVDADPDLAPPDLDAVVIMTCGFIADAKRQSVEAAVAWAERKKQTGRPGRLYIAGCLAQRHGRELFEEIPEVDGLLGVGQTRDLAGMLAKKDGERRMAVHDRPCTEITASLPRLRIETGPAGWLKIADGCDHRCTFCAIPAMKGPMRSVPREIVLAEARSLLRNGVREFNLIAQDTTAYGADLYGNYRLPELLTDLCALPGDFRVRCLYAYPGGVTNKLLGVMSEQPKIAPYLDIPLQHLDPGVLRGMRRPNQNANVAGLAARIRRLLPGAVLRTTLMTGFPGETPQAFRRMLDAVRELRFHWLGVFAYSPEAGTPAASLPGLPARATRERRRARLLGAQAEITAELNAARVGRAERVIVERFDPDRNCWQGRGPGEAPGVDGVVWLRGGANEFAPGRFVSATITAAGVYDVSAEPSGSGG